MAKQNLKSKPDEKKAKDSYNPTGDELKVWNQFQRRKHEMINGRNNVHGIDVDEQMRNIDRTYFDRQANIPPSELDPEQTPIAINNAFSKIQAALSILIDRNPKLILDEKKPRFSANRELIRSLAEASWKNTNSLHQLKLSIFNMAKRGWFIGRTFNRVLKHDGRFLKEVDNKGMKRYEDSVITKMDDIAYMNLDNHNAWIDEEARPFDYYSARDGMHRELWHIDKIREMFPVEEFPNMKFVNEGGNTLERIKGDSTQTSTSTQNARETKKGLTEIFFYEHQFDDWFIVEVNGVMVVWEPLPQNHKRLSYVWGPWNLRSAEDIYGIGLVEELERDEQLIDRILNMTMRQLLLTISVPGFYTGPDDFENENIKLKPGVLRRVQNPNDITWAPIPPGNQRGLEHIQWLENKEDQRTGITKTLEGEVNLGGQDTAFELGISREAALKRLRLPLKSLQYALNWEFRNRIDLIQQTYSDFQVDRLATEREIQEYLDEVNADPDFYFIENEGQPGKERFFVKRFREVQLSLEKNEKGEFVESETKKFFKIKPEFLPWEGDVTVDVNSLLVQSEELERADTLRMTNLLVPLLAQPIEIALKPVRQLLLAFNKDPKKWLPDAWVTAMEGRVQQRPPRQQTGESPATGEQRPPQPLVPENQLRRPSLGQRFGAAFRGFRNPAAQQENRPR